MMNDKSLETVAEREARRREQREHVKRAIGAGLVMLMVLCGGILFCQLYDFLPEPWAQAILVSIPVAGFCWGCWKITEKSK